MGQKRVTLVDLSAREEQTKVSQKRAAKSVKKTVKGGKGTGRIADKSEPLEDAVLEEAQITPVEEKPEATKAAAKKKHRQRSRRYKLARSMVDRTNNYPADQGIELIKKTTVARFDATVSAHLNLTETGLTKDVIFPHPTGKKMRIAIASDELVSDIEAKKINFDILLASPDMMKKIAKVAKILGPLGLMPNPKNGTIVAAPEKRKQELESGTTQVKSEPKAPLMHVVVGKISLGNDKVAANVKALIEAIGIRNIKKLTLASSMSPGVKVDLTEFQKTQ